MNGRISGGTKRKSIAVGNPCKVIRYITEGDRKYYHKNQELDVEDYCDGAMDMNELK